MAARWKKLAAYAAAVAVLGGVFALYTQPQTMVALSEMVWACFGSTR
jgi:hypothetical protein